MELVKEKLRNIKVGNTYLRVTFVVLIAFALFGVLENDVIILIPSLLAWAYIGSRNFINWSHNRFFKRQSDLVEHDVVYVEKNLEAYLLKFKGKRLFDESHFRKVDEVLQLLKSQS